MKIKNNKSNNLGTAQQGLFIIFNSNTFTYL